MVRPIGIDLGTTYTVVATLEHGRPRVLPNAEGQRLTPSVVAFTSDGGTLVGQAAKLQAWANPEQSIFSVKRLIGSGARVRGGGVEHTPEAISSLILRKVKADAEADLRERLDAAVITVPAYFDDRQRQATRDAGRLAGLDVLRILSEPTAAALAYGLAREAAHTILVWDLGGGTFDVSVLELGEGIFEVRAVSGDTRLGGDDFDGRLADLFAQQYRQACGQTAADDRRVHQALREAAEKAKIQLSTSRTARVYLPCAAGPAGTPFVTLTVTRAGLERLTADLLQRLVPPTVQALADAGLTPHGVDRMLLVGGATRMPAVRRLARRLLGREPYRCLDPDETVALGAAIQAGMLLGAIEKAVLLDVLPLSLGVETQGGLVARIISRNSPLPVSEGRVFSTAADSQTAMDVHVLQGERPLAADNISLGQLHLDGIPAAPRGVAKVEVAFAADVDGIVHVTARDLLTDTAVAARLAVVKQLDTHEIERLAAAAARYAARDRVRQAQIQATIEAGSALAAAEVAFDELNGRAPNRRMGGGRAPHPAAQPLATAAAAIKEALAAGAVEETRCRCADLRRLLAAAQEARCPAAGTLGAIPPAAERVASGGCNAAEGAKA